MNHLKYISYLKVIGIILVVFGHSFHEWDGDFSQTILYRIFLVMRMPLFTFTSGFTLAYCFVTRSHNRNYGEFIANKAWRLLLPFFVLNTLTFLPRAALNGIADDAVELSLSSYITSILISGKAAVRFTWFLQMSFICMLITYPLLLAYRQKATRNIALTALLIFAIYTHLSYCFGNIVFFSINEMGKLLIFFALGALCGNNHKVFINRFPWTNPFFPIICIVGWMGSFFINEQLQLPVISLLSSIFGIMMTLSGALLLEKHKITILDHLSGSTYMIFLLSWYVNVTAQQVLHHFLPLPWWVHTTLSWVGGIYLPLLVHRFLIYNKEHHAYKRTILFLLGHK